MGRDDWYRSSDWDAKARAEFETRLARARGDTRVQYRRIKALALLESTDGIKATAGREMLLSIVHDGDAPRFEVVGALCLLGAHLHDTGAFAEAEVYLRHALAVMGTNESGSTGLEAIRLAEILLDRGRPDDLAEAQDLLERRAADPPTFVASRFRLALAATKVALARGQAEVASDWARAALTYASAKHSGLANHPTLLLAKANKSTRAWLESVAAGKPRDTRKP